MRCLTILILAAVTMISPAAAEPTDKVVAAQAQWADCELLFTAKIDRVIGGPVGMSEPPMWNHRLELTVVEAFRGRIAKGEKVTANHTARQKTEPSFPEGKVCVVAADVVRRLVPVPGGKEEENTESQTIRVNKVELVSDEDIEPIKAAAAIPLGWSISEGKLVSPWAELGKGAWPEAMKSDRPLACGITGRPVLGVGKEATFTVVAAPPAKPIRWTNPDGDGDYVVTVANPTDKPLTVPALLTDGEKVLWDECIVIRCQGKSYAVPGCRGVSGTPKPVTLKPGEKISATVHALTLDGPEWPRGGYRIEFQICLGDRAATHSFYYMSKHHDPVREEALAKLRESQKQDKKAEEGRQGEAPKD